MASSRGPITRPRPSWGWQDDAACRGQSLTLFFGYEGERAEARDARERMAKAICAECPVRRECVEFALSRPEKYGIWSLTEDERASVRRRRMRRAAMAGVSAAPSNEVVKEEEKHCSSCRTTWPVANFARDISKRDGLQTWCRRCTNAARARKAEQAVAS
ncbi:WhiB family transcriptional regulator [Nonomuraea sp. NPDC049400]|uniref:WhiB family transcriptional regulator n=1 Tax=Nonomuraea sp. NPDC049400 TaxID=3364352 RepID=UPI0037ACE36E